MPTMGEEGRGADDTGDEQPSACSAEYGAEIDRRTSDGFQRVEARAEKP